jgi:DNA-nicking Smr family endonuclease
MGKGTPKDHTRGQEKSPAKKPSAGFHTPFRNLPAVPPPAASSTPIAPPATRVAQSPPPRDDEKAFQQAMRGVTPLGGPNRQRVAIDPGSGPDPPATPRSAPSAVFEDALVEAELADLIENANALRVEEVGESSSGLAPGVDRRLLKRLRSGQFAVDEQLDLHTLTRPEAQAALTRLVDRMRAAGKRCLLVIHGRGHGSGPDGAVLKGAVRHLLARSPLSRVVLAFTSAPPSLGGDGALLVLLRRKV